MQNKMRSCKGPFRRRLNPGSVGIGAAVWLSVLSAMASCAHADDLMEVYRSALAHDPAYRSAAALARSAQPRAEQAAALLLPTLSVAGSSGRSVNDPPDMPLAPSPSGQVRSSQWSVKLRQPLLNLGNRADVDKAELSLMVSELDFELFQQDFAVKVAQIYFDVLAAENALSTARANKVAIEGQLRSATRNFEAGTAIITDMREAQARFDLAVADELAAENEVSVRHVALDRLVGRANVKPDGLVSPPVVPVLAPAESAAWLQMAESHPSIRRAQLQLDLARKETERAQAAHWPTLDVVASGDVSRNTGEGAALPGTTRSRSVMLELNATMFSGFSVQNKIRESVILEEKAHEDWAEARRVVFENASRAYLGAQSGLARIKALEAAEVSSQLALETTRLGYQVGVRVNLDVLNAQSQLSKTKQDLAKARYDALLAQLRLYQAAGQLKPAQLEQVNQSISRQASSSPR